MVVPSWKVGAAAKRLKIIAPARIGSPASMIYFPLRMTKTLLRHTSRCSMPRKSNPHGSTDILPDKTNMNRTASAVWQGDLKKGQGTLSTQSGVLNKTQYSFSTRFESGIGTNPEELIAAAHAGCFTMALSAFLIAAGFTPEELTTEATLTLEQVESNWTITAVHLDLTGRVPGLDAAKFEEIANQAKAGCPGLTRT